MSAEMSFFLLGGAVLAGATYGLRRYRSPLNPLTISAAVGFGLFTLLSGVIVYSRLSMAPYPPEELAQTAQISLVNFLGMLVPYLFHGPLPAKLFGWGIRCLGLGSERVASRFSSLKFVLLLGSAVGAFIVMAVVGGGGLLWLTDTRLAYIEYRAGVGPFFATMQWFMMVALLYYLWARRPCGFKFLLVLGLFTFLAFFSGSKGILLAVLVMGIVYYEYRVRPVPLFGLAMLVPLFLSGVAVLLVVQGSQETLLGIVTYFNDYFDTTTQFLSRFDEFGFRYGAAWLSSFWFYVPRGLYPNKPYEYGITLIHEVLFPGMAAIGNTPGLLGWSLVYLDFGVVGVFLAGCLDGWWRRAAYEHFLRHRQSFFAFLFMMQFAVWAVLPFATVPITVVFSVALSIYFRFVLHLDRPQAQRTVVMAGRLPVLN